MIALLSQWAKSDEREARRSDRIGDRAGDDELDAYNRMLAGLAQRDQASGPAPLDAGLARSTGPGAIGTDGVVGGRLAGSDPVGGESVDPAVPGGDTR
jgi:hypothetical protein